MIPAESCACMQIAEEARASGLRYYAERADVTRKDCVAGGGTNASDEEDQAEAAEDAEPWSKIH